MYAGLNGVTGDEFGVPVVRVSANEAVYVSHLNDIHTLRHKRGIFLVRLVRITRNYV